MGSTDNIQITDKLTTTMKKEVAALFAQTFQQKIEHLWIMTSSQEKAISILSESIQQGFGYVALCDNTVIGFIALQDNQDSFFTVTRKQFIDEFGFFGGTWRAFYQSLLHLFTPKVKHDDVKIDVIAVAPDHQGVGIGRALLDESLQYAKKVNAQRIILDVVDTNPRAKRLYVTLGFEILKEERYGRFTQRAGFTGSTYMGKNI